MTTELAPRRTGLRTSLKRKSDLDFESPPTKKQAGHTTDTSQILKQHAGPADTGSQILMAPQADLYGISSSVILDDSQDPQSNHENHPSLSQASATSQSSQTSTAMKSSTTSDESMIEASPTLDRATTANQAQSLKLQIPQPSERSRSPSIGSADETTRSSSRSRKPTAKAQALADAGTRFYKSLKPLPDPIEGQNDNIASPVVETSPTSDTEVAMVAPISEPEEGVLDSVESPSIRTSPRTRKPTAKVLAETTNQPTNKRKAIADEIGRPSKIARLSSAIPDKPSKLRYSISSTEEEVGNKNAADKAEELLDGSNATPSCALSCLSPSKKLLAMVKFVLDTEDDEDDENIETLLAAANSEVDGTGSFKMFNRFAGTQKCVCDTAAPPLEVNEQHDSNTLIEAVKPSKTSKPKAVKTATPVTRTSLRRTSARKNVNLDKDEAEIVTPDSEKLGEKMATSEVRASTGPAHDQVGESPSRAVFSGAVSTDVNTVPDAESNVATPRPRSILKLKIVGRKLQAIEYRESTSNDSVTVTQQNEVVGSPNYRSKGTSALADGTGGVESKPYDELKKNDGASPAGLQEDISPCKPTSKCMSSEDLGEWTPAQSESFWEAMAQGEDMERRKRRNEMARKRYAKKRIEAGKTTTSSGREVDKESPVSGLASKESRDRWLNVALPAMIADTPQRVQEKDARDAAAKATVEQAAMAVGEKVNK